MNKRDKCNSVSVRYNQIQMMARSVDLNLSFLNSISSSVNILESSIQFPLLECMERRFHFKEIILEYPHPVFQNKRCDLFWNDGTDRCLLEMKYNKGNNNKKEILKDLVRQYFTVEKGFCAYFMFCSQSYESTEQNALLDNRDVLNATINHQRTGDHARIPQFDWLSVDMNNPECTVNLSYKKDKLYEYLSNKYDFIESNQKFPEDITFQTKLVCQILPTNDFSLSHYVGVWEILKKYS